MSTPQQPQAGWYPDPQTPGTLRFWDGATWTAHTSAPNPQPPAPAAPTVAAVAEPRKSPGVDTNTVWIWLIVLLPLASSLLALLVPWRSMFAMQGWMAFNSYAQPDNMSDMRMFMQPFDIFFSPWWWAITLFGWAIYGFSVWFAYLDQRELRNRGIDRPFPWPWMFLSIVYPIGRIVVAIRRTGAGWGPLWGLIATQVVGIIVGVVISTQITLATFQFLTSIARYGGYSG